MGRNLVDVYKVNKLSRIIENIVLCGSFKNAVID